MSCLFPARGVAGFVVLALISSSPAAAGLERLHRTVVSGPFVCFADHTHRGGSRPSPTRAEAYGDAVRSWAALVTLEYGAKWAVFDQSAGRQITCQPTFGLRGDPAWTCRIASRPCRPAH